MNKKIMIVDDEKDIVRMLYRFLSKKGYKITTAFDGLEALEKISIVMPDLIILDILIPKLDGILVDRKLKSNPLTKKIPVIFITGKNNQLETKRVLESEGIYGYLQKPFLLEELLPKVEEALNMVK